MSVDLIIEFTCYVLNAVKKSKVAATIIEHNNLWSPQYS